MKAVAVLPNVMGMDPLAPWPASEAWEQNGTFVAPAPQPPGGPRARAAVGFRTAPAAPVDGDSRRPGDSSELRAPWAGPLPLRRSPSAGVQRGHGGDSAGHGGSGNTQECQDS